MKEFQDLVQFDFEAAAELTAELEGWAEQGMTDLSATFIFVPKAFTHPMKVALVKQGGKKKKE